MAKESIPHLPVNHLFVDYENIKQLDVSVISGKNLTFHLFFGPQNQKLDLSVVECLLDNAQAVKMIRTSKSGRNALDFVLAYHLGQAVLADPKGFYHIVSRDNGYDALVELLKSKHVKVKRHEDWGSLHFTSPSPPVPPPLNGKNQPPPPAYSPAAMKLLDNLRKSERNRPKKSSTLMTHAMSVCGRKKPQGDAEKVIRELQKAGHLLIDTAGMLTYKL